MAKKNHNNESNDADNVIRVLSKRPGSIVLSTGKRLELDRCMIVTEDEAKELEMLVGPLVQRVD